jgi:hypothetical protein
MRIMSGRVHTRVQTNLLMLSAFALLALFGCSSSEIVTERSVESFETGTQVTSLTTTDGQMMDFTRELPGCALVRDSVVEWSPTESGSREIPLSTVQSMSIVRFSWWKTALFAISIPVVAGIITVLTWHWP